MNGKLRNLGLALLAVFVLGAVVAAGASAEGSYIIDSSHTTIEGNLIAEGAAEFEAKFGTVKCTESTFVSTVSVEGEESEEAKEPVSDVTFTPTYSGCKLGELKVTIDMNGCQYTFTAPEETEESPPFDLHAQMHIVNCSGPIKFTATGCTVEIPEQTPSTPTAGLTVLGAEPFETQITPTVEGFSYSYSGFLCGSGSGENGAYRGPVEVQGMVVVASEWFEIKKVGGTAPGGGARFCQFTALGQTCLIKFNNKTPRTLVVVGTSLHGPTASNRYKVTNLNCVFNLGVGECTDTLEVIKFVAGAVDDYCLSVRDAGNNNALHVECAALRM